MEVIALPLLTLVWCQSVTFLVLGHSHRPSYCCECLSPSYWAPFSPLLPFCTADQHLSCAVTISHPGIAVNLENCGTHAESGAAPAQIWGHVFISLILADLLGKTDS